MLSSITGASQQAEPRTQSRSTAEHEPCRERRRWPYAAIVTWKPGDFIASPQDAEEFAAVHMRGLGYDDAVRTPTGPDGGVDVRSSRALAQVKQTATQVGRPDVQRLVGARGREHHLDLVFYSAVGYSRSAIEYGDDMEVALFVYDVTGEVTAANVRANIMVQAAAVNSAAEEKTAREKAESDARARRGCAWFAGVWLAIFSVGWVVVWFAAGVTGRGGAWPNVLVGLGALALLGLAARRAVRQGRERKAQAEPRRPGTTPVQGIFRRPERPTS